MSAALSLLALALPTLLVVAAFFLWRDHASRFRHSLWLILGPTWATSAWFLIGYSRQTDDVGLMVYGIVGGAALLSAVAASTVAIILGRRR